MYKAFTYNRYSLPAYFDHLVLCDIVDGITIMTYCTVRLVLFAVSFICDFFNYLHLLEYIEVWGQGFICFFIQ